MKKRSLSGNIGIGIFVIAFICILIAFCAPSWLVSDVRITGGKFDRLGLWVQCFRSLADPTDDHQRRFFVGCRWIYDPFTTGYVDIREYLRPPFIIVTQLFYTLAFIGALVSFILVLLFFLCFRPEQKLFHTLVLSIGGIMIGAGICSLIAVVVFAIWANREDWMLGHDNNFFGWAFGVAIVGIIAAFISGGLFLVEATIQKKKQKYMKDSQTQFEMEHETKA